MGGRTTHTQEDRALGESLQARLAAQAAAVQKRKQQREEEEEEEEGQEHKDDGWGCWCWSSPPWGLAVWAA